MQVVWFEDVAMHVSVGDAKGQLTELVRRAGAVDDIVLTRHGHPAVRLVPVTPTIGVAARKALLDEVRASAAKVTVDGSRADRSQDFLYEDDGLPG